MSQLSSNSQTGKLYSQAHPYQFLEKCLQNMVKSLRDKPGSCRHLAKVFKEMYKEYPEVLQLISDEFGEKYETTLKQSFDERIERYDLKEKLCKLMELPDVDDGGWRHSGDPESDMRAHIALQKQNEITGIQAEIAKEDAEIQELEKLLSQKEKLIEEKLLHVNSLNEDIVSASKIALSAQDVIWSNCDQK